MKRVVGIGLIVAGFALLIITPFSGITGHVVGIGKGISSVLGLAFVVGGLVLFLVSPLESLSNHDRNIIKSSFKDWDGKINKRQKKS